MDDQQRRNDNQQSAKDTPPQAPRSIQGNDLKESDGPEGNRNNRETVSYRLTDILMVVFTGVIAATGFFGWRTLHGQQDIMQGQLDAMKADERPWVGVQSFVLGAPTVNPPSVNITLVNSGRSPARLLNSYIGWGTMAPYPIDPIYGNNETPYGPGRAIIVPNQTVGANEKLNPLPFIVFAAIQNPSVDVFVYALIQYEDVVENVPHQTTLCWIYDPKNKVWDYCPGYNDAN